MTRCPNCGERVYRYGCVNCNEAVYIEMQDEFDGERDIYAPSQNVPLFSEIVPTAPPQEPT